MSNGSMGAVSLKENPKRRLHHHEKSSIHIKAIFMRTNARTEETLRSARVIELPRKITNKRTLWNITH